MNNHNAILVIYKSHDETEIGVMEPHQAGFDMTKLSIVARDSHNGDDVVGCHNAGHRMKHWGKLGAFWTGMWGLLLGSAFFASRRLRLPPKPSPLAN